MEPENKIQNKNVQTYAQDMAEVLEDNKEGLIKKIIHEEEERELEKKNLSPESRKNKMFMVVSLSLTFIGLLIICVFLFRTDVYTVAVPPQFTPMIFTDKTDFPEISGLSRDSVIQTVANEVRNTEVKTGGVEGIYPTENKKIIGFKRFLTLIKSSFIPAPGTSVSDNFLMGAVNENSKDFFILLRVRSFEDTFNELRAWEPKMFADLSGLFGIELTGETTSLLTQSFEDGIIQNKNARMLRNADGSIAMMYIFLNDTSVLFTATEDSTREVMLRLAASTVKK